MSPGRVLFISEGQLGDLLLMTPALRAVKRTFPQATQSVLILDRRVAQPSGRAALHQASLFRSGSDTVLATNPHVADVTVIDREAFRSLPLLQRLSAELRAIRFIRSRKYDTVICTFPEDRFAVWAFLSGARVRVGQKDQPLARLLTHSPDVRKDAKGVLEYYCDLVRTIDAHPDSSGTEYHLPQEAERWAADHMRSLGLDRAATLVAVHPGATGDYKIWPPERYAAVIDALDGVPDLRTALFCGGPDEAVVTEIGLRTARPPTILRTTGNLAHFAGLLRRCSLLISNDSGPRHLAAALGIPTVALFRRHHDREWKVYPDSPTCVTLKGNDPCPSCPEGACLDRVPEGERFGAYCLRMIEAEEVLGAVRGILGLSGTKPEDHR